ncbi:MAG: glycosyltransferase family 2 protein [Nitrososphaerota archaeon]|nr:glycosyltransferase family 2 protein [Nitrososphaerota archaeon]
MSVVVLIPAYNEESSIAKVLLGAMKHADRVVVCDDGSNDLTAEIAEKLGAEVLRHERNLGYGASLSSLFGAALSGRGDVVVTLDADGQHDPEAIPQLVEPILKDQADVVVGSRFLGKGEGVPGYRKVGIRVITGVSNQAGDIKITDAQSGFRAYSKKVIESVTPADLGMGASTEILLRAGRANLRVAEVPITVSYDEKAARNPVYHGVEVLFSTFKHLSILHPLMVYGLPATVFILYGLYLGSNALRVYESARVVLVGSTLIAIGMILVGLILGITALILWIMITLMRDPLYRNARSFGPAVGARRAARSTALS